MIKREIHITQNQLNELEKEKELTGMSRAEIVRRAIDFYLENKNRGINTNDSNKR